ncbi:myoglobin-like [Babylonia areolata]|uniref:myoglobin-like n=1 Tax=Babylonia areolata TaxID=304850 RepID=UPI003FD15AFA
MGCLQTKRKKDDHKKVKKPTKPMAGSLETGIPADQATDFSSVVVSSQHPMTVKQCFSLIQSWRAIRRNITGTGVEMFIMLFKNNADLLHLFSDFKHLQTEDDFRNNETVEHHATLVMTTLDETITHIDNYDYVTEVLRKTADTHAHIKGFQSRYFWKIKDPFLEAVKTTLGDRYTENMETIYKVAITFVLQTLTESYDSAVSDPVKS